MRPDTSNGALTAAAAGGHRSGGRAAGRGRAEQVRIDRGQERRPAGGLLGAVPGPPGRAGEHQPAAGPGHPDEQQPPLLRGLGRGQRPGSGQPQRQQAAFAAGQEHHVELQALGAVQGQQGDRLGPRIQRVGLRAERRSRSRNRSRSVPHRRASGASTSPAARMSTTVASRSPRAAASARTAAVSCPRHIAGRAASSAHQAHLAHDVGHRGPAGEQVVRALLVRQPGPGQRLAERRRPARRSGTARRCRTARACRARARRPGRCPASGTRPRRAAGRSRRRSRPPRRARPPPRGRKRRRARVAASGADRARGRPARDQRGRRDGLHRGGHDGRARPVVPGQLHRGGRREVRREPAEDADVGAAEAVDRLVRVADRGQPGAVAADRAEQVVLHRVDVLVLIHADERPPGPQPGRDAPGARPAAPPTSRPGRRSRPGRGRSAPRAAPAAPSGSSASPASSLRPSRSDPVSSAATRSRAASSATPNRGGSPAASWCSRRIRRPRPWNVVTVSSAGSSRAAAARQPGQPVPHLLRRPPGERDGQELPGGQAQLGDLVGDAVGERPGLAGARPGDDQQRPGGRRRGPLVRIQPVEHRSRRGTGAADARPRPPAPARRRPRRPATGAGPGLGYRGPFGGILCSRPAGDGQVGHGEQRRPVQFVRAGTAGWCRTPRRTRRP